MNLHQYGAQIQSQKGAAITRVLTLSANKAEGFSRANEERRIPFCFGAFI